MLTATERHDLMGKLRRLPAAVETAVKDLTDAQLKTPYREGGWTAGQVVHHLADSHLNGFLRMKLMLTEVGPVLKPYDQDAWAKLSDTAAMPIESSLLILRGLHERWVALLENLPEASWKRSAFHPEVGVVTLADLLADYARHGEQHLEQLTRLRAAQGW
jgi:DinB superfamily